MFKLRTLAFFVIVFFLFAGLSCARPHDLEIRNCTNQEIVGYFFDSGIPTLKTPFALRAKERLTIKNAVGGFVGDKYIFIYSLDGKQCQLKVTIEKFAPESFIVSLGKGAEDHKDG